MKYKKKPVEVEAVLLEPTQKSIRKVLEFMGQSVVLNCDKANGAFDDYCCQAIAEGFIRIKTLESDNETQVALFGDYIIKGVEGECYPCKPDIFHKTYDKVDNN